VKKRLPDRGVGGMCPEDGGRIMDIGEFNDAFELFGVQAQAGESRGKRSEYNTQKWYSS